MHSLWASTQVSNGGEEAVGIQNPAQGCKED